MPRPMHSGVAVRAVCVLVVVFWGLCVRVCVVFVVLCVFGGVVLVFMGCVFVRVYISVHL